ncbi:MAG: selenocysteine-specific translation elongation factor [Thermoanaerobaculia bacterium]
MSATRSEVDATAERRPTLLVGTAGHVDHGKTALVRALTGIDCDRLAEEKARGITIDLGFAHLERGGAIVGFVDVPGHHKFLHNALAGLGGIRCLLLVVAADEGVKPQTREHLAVARLLAIPHLIVALTKIDLARPAATDLVELELGELLADSPWPRAPIHRLSSASGDGVERLADALVGLARDLPEERRGARPARLPIDRVFALRGQGVVVTGTLVAGEIAPGATLHRRPEELATRVRSLQVHGRPRARALAGERVALQLAGVETTDLERGDELVAGDGARPTRRLLARFTLLAEAGAELARPLAVRLFVYAAERMAWLRPLSPAALAPGTSGIVELRLARALAATRGDRFVVRRPSPAATLGGGEILDPWWRPIAAARRAEILPALAGELPRALVAWITAAAEAGATYGELAARAGLTLAEVAASLAPALERGELAALGQGAERRVLQTAAITHMVGEARALLADFFRREPLAPAMPRAEFLRRLLAKNALPLGDFYLAALAAAGIASPVPEGIAPPGRFARLSSDETGLAGQILARYAAAGLEGPSPAQVARELGAKPQIVEGLVRYLVRQGELVKLPGELVLASSALARVERELVETGWQRFSVPQFKERFSLTRKWAIPILEALDARGVTRRQGDVRLVRPRRPADHADSTSESIHPEPPSGDPPNP